MSNYEKYLERLAMRKKPKRKDENKPKAPVLLRKKATSETLEEFGKTAC